ncbi:MULTISPECIES: AlpA family phage regulatory protein [Aeromonas]|uniref:AlpA family phage regulatory protein n=1 Tax=Aeromonas bestiarum TaxID=105751 RepID=A0ABT7Q5V1_9GAMM|nr:MULTISPECIES: AlpA family phage regulatory protein [Aeromonas]EJN6954273.1 AlpA family phage regulatory protein [Aeromonas hydrophila]EKP0314978.1 AlpA family phage regulatory protein [Aeromonas veronii]MCX0439114.1 AlpA family phage regulatory protein [Aeromonas veronii]MDM5074701.1 AlpA family phage regulatory protein [Aeromonas bestiarum]USJ78385.1 AlpA family phage regulatory protein [Aeromonas hydrophila]
MNTPIKVLRIDDVTQKTGLARSTIYDRIDKKSPRYDSSFPKRIKLGLAAVGWFEHEIDAWLYAQASMRDA